MFWADTSMRTRQRVIVVIDECIDQVEPGKAIADQAKPLGRCNVYKKVRKNSNEVARLKKRNAIMKDGRKEMLRRTSAF